MSRLDDVLADLAAEGDALRTLVAPLAESAWSTPTPAAGWSIATQVAHLAWTDVAASLAARAHDGTEGRAAWDALVLAALADPEEFVDASAHDLAAQPAAALLQQWDDGRATLAQALRDVPDGERLPWFGPPMAPASMATARFMETWAHSLDVHEALGVQMEATDRVRHVAHLGVRTRGFAFATHGREKPDVEPRVELVAPSGAFWTWGPDDAAEHVTGSAIDFARLVTQRVHRGDTDLVAEGPGADAWLDLGQAFAGPPGVGREPRR